MMKKYLLILAAFALSVVSAADENGKIRLNGGEVEPLSLKVIESSTLNLNFCHGYLYSDGMIYFDYSLGVHTVTEKGRRIYSPDKGKTWIPTDVVFGGFCAYEGKDGTKYNIIGGWDEKIADEHTIVRHILNPDGKSTTVERSRIKMPFTCSFRLQRDVLRCRDGRLMMAGYGRKVNAPKFFSFLVQSVDDGKSWQYVNTVMEDPDSKYQEGPNEGAVIELRNGDLLFYARTASEGSLYQLRSNDGGMTWNNEGTIADFNVAPAAHILQNGTLIVVTGRPGLYMLVDFTGTGKNYQKLPVYTGSGSSYASIMEVAPNELMLIYDESDFGTWRHNLIMSSIMAMTLKFTKNDNIVADTGDPEAAKWDHYYSGASNKLPQELKVSYPISYVEKGGESYFELVSIPERPHPVLRLVHHGDKTPGAKFSHFSFAGAPLGTTKMTIGSEFRLQDAAEQQPQYAIRFAFDSGGKGGGIYGWVAFGINEITYMDNGEYKTVPFNCGLNFQEFTVKADLKTNRYQLFHKDGANALLTGRMIHHKDIPVGITWGDGTSKVFGTVEVSRIGWKFD